MEASQGNLEIVLLLLSRGLDIRSSLTGSLRPLLRAFNLVTAINSIKYLSFVPDTGILLLR